MDPYAALLVIKYSCVKIIAMQQSLPIEIAAILVEFMLH